MGRRFVTHNALVAGGVVMSGVLGFVFQAAASHRLHPADYGGAFAVIALLMLVGPPTNAVALLLARETSRGIANNDRTAADGLLHHGMRWALLVGLGLTLVVGLASPLIGAFLRVPAAWVLVGCISMPFRLATPILNGTLNGEQRFLATSAMAVGQAVFKLLVALAMAVAWGGFGLVAGTSLSGVLTFAVMWRLAWRHQNPDAPPPDWRRALGYLLRVSPATLGFTSLITLDVVLVKHYLSPQAAGEYAVVAALGRSAYWVALGINQVLFPKVVSHDASRRRSGGLVFASLGLILAAGLASLALFGLGAPRLIRFFAGDRYPRGANYLAWYGAAMVLLGAAMVFVTTQQSRGRVTFLWVLAPVTLLEPVLIILFHPFPREVAQVVALCMALLLAGLVSLHLWESRRGADGIAAAAT